MAILGFRKFVKKQLKNVLGVEEEKQETSSHSVQVPTPAATPDVAAKSPEVPKPIQTEELSSDPPTEEIKEQKEEGPEKITHSPAEDLVGQALSLEAVQEILDDMVRPALQGDGGDIELIKIEDDSIFVKLVGACSTCPSSTMTMKMGVEALLREEFPGMKDLIDIGAEA